MRVARAAYIAAAASCYKYHVKVLETVEKSPFVDCRVVRPSDMGKSFFHHTFGGKSSITKGMFYPRVPKKRIKRLMPEEVNTAYEEFHTFRDKLIFKGLYYTDMRIGELLGLQVEDYETPDTYKKFGAIEIVKRNNNKPPQRQKQGGRTIGIPMKLIPEIEEY